MTEFISYLILGAAVGGSYAQLALGIVAQYRVSNVINFSSCANALCSIYLFTDLQSRVGALVAAICAVLAGALVGAATYAVAIWPLRHASTLMMAISTIAVLVITQSALVMIFGSTARIAKGFLPDAHVALFGASVTADYLIILALVFVLAAGLALIHRRTVFGLATTALAQEPLALEVVGRAPVTVASINWALGGALSALAGVLISPITGATPGQATSLLIPALAAALVGNLGSFGLAVVGGVAVGALSSITTLYSNTGPLTSVPGLAMALPFLVIMIMLIVRGKSIPGRDHVAAWFPSIGQGALTWPRAVVIGVASALLINIMPPPWLSVVTSGLIGAVLLESVVLVTGMVGQLSLAQASFAGVGAFVAAQLASSAGVPFPLAAICGVLAALPVGFVVGLPSVRTRGVMLGVVPLGLSSAIQALLFNNLAITGGGEVVALLGANGAGKTTTLRALSGQTPVLAGRITIDDGRPLRGLHRHVQAGIGVLPERRCLAMTLTAGENLRLGRGSTADAVRLFPDLESKLDTQAGLLSGGEQQMLALARILAARPRIVLADELSLGLAPKVVTRLLAALSEAARAGAAVLIVEQHVRLALRAADRAYVLRRGSVVLSGAAADLQADDKLISGAYL